MSTNRRRLAFESLESRRVLSGGTAAAVTVFVNIPGDLTGQPGGQVVAPVDIDNAAGIRGAEIHIHYDTTLLDASQSSVTAGSVWPEGTQVVANVDDDAGTIVAFVSTAVELGTGSGSLLNVEFVIANDASVGSQAFVDLTGIILNEGAILANTANGKITVVSPSDTAAVSGVVYADTNSNNQPDQFEGIPGVKVVLVNIDSGQQRDTFTDDNGRYEFDDLAAGSYRVQEQQPAAFLDGGPNEISVTLASGQSLTDQNFRERGLRPEYVYNRLFTTTALPVGSANWISAIRRIVSDAGTSSTQTQTVSTSTLMAANNEAISSAVPAVQPQATEQSATAETSTDSSNTAPVAALSAANTEPESSIQSAASAIQAASSVFVHVPDNLTGHPGGQAVAPVNIDTAAGIRGAEIHITYDTTLLDASQSGVTAGSVWPEGTQVVANVDDTAGTIVAYVSTAEELGAGGGSLLNVEFTVKSDASVGSQAFVDLTEIILNEGAIPANTANGKITVVSPGDTASISGVVYADTNGNDHPDQYEGIPRVKVVLVNTDNGQQRETFTEDDGSYTFPDLAAGSYLIQERQPAAFLDGGTNEISASLASGQSLTDQNFRERGLRPEYVCNRLLTTTALPVGSANWISTVRRIVTDADNAAYGSGSAELVSDSLAGLSSESERLASVDLAFGDSDSWLADT